MKVNVPGTSKLGQGRHSGSGQSIHVIPKLPLTKNMLLLGIFNCRHVSIHVCIHVSHFIQIFYHHLHLTHESLLSRSVSSEVLSHFIQIFYHHPPTYPSSLLSRRSASSEAETSYWLLSCCTVWGVLPKKGFNHLTTQCFSVVTMLFLLFL